MKCDKCDKEATYDSPNNLCDEHWAEWWAEGIVDDPGEIAREKEEVLKSIQYNDSIMRTNNPNVFGEYIRDLAFKKENEYDFGCYSTFELNPFFRDIAPDSTFGQKVLGILVDSYCPYEPVEQEDMDFVRGAGRMVTDGGMVVAWYWDGDGVLLVGCRGKFAINDDCKKDYNWKWVKENV
jgi:hypothetical protein